MRGAQQDGTIAGDPLVFVRNEPVIVVPAPNPAGITALKDLARPGVRLVLAGRDVPIGGYARQILQNAARNPDYGADFADRVLANVVSEEPNVRASLAKVVLGEADATFVYRSDITPDVRDRVRVVEVPAGLNLIADYYIARVKDGPNPAGAQVFIDFALSSEGQEILARWGFRPVKP
jgi:molybdate transport system substrate-binding protein